MPLTTVRTRRPSTENTSRSVRPALASENANIVVRPNGFGIAGANAVTNVRGATASRPEPTGVLRFCESRASTCANPNFGSPAAMTRKCSVANSPVPTRPWPPPANDAPSTEPGSAESTMPPCASMASPAVYDTGWTTAGSYDSRADSAWILPVNV